ncbi:hypothetical protein BN946_scf184911.g82 [Trametes cinnabarina]|uniref:Enoyl reductase (ER) domain-containing protein n=1 Tax=Pycnoporus cinnabarinus TaxID=5643 RepID=A0A060SAS4_PYCCI|nr:hypothetical protein BN946_scf184911.g82 [Trametes cinnabarina]
MGLLPGFILRRVQAAEFDLAGVVVDGNNTDLKEGDEVFGWIPLGNPGCDVWLTCAREQFFDYTKSPLHEQLIAANPTPKYDVFLEAVGVLDPTLFLKSEAYLDPHGVFISVGPQGSGVGNYVHFVWNVLLKPGFLGGVKRKWKLVSVKPVEKDIREFAKLVEEGKIKPVVDSVYEFEDALKAYERILTKRATGKVVVRVDPTAA